MRAAVPVLLLALALRLGWILANGVSVPIGPDSALWVLVGLDWANGATPPLPPLYPSFAALAFALGLSGEAVARGVSLLAGALVAPTATYALGRLGADRFVAVAVGVALAFTPDLVFESALTQPDSLTQLWLVAMAGVGLAQIRAPSGPGAVRLILLASAGVLLRETGLAVVGVAALLLAFRPGPGGRWRWPLGLLLAAHVAPLTLGLRPWFPLTRAPWAAKAAIPQEELKRVLGEGFVPSYSAHPSDSWVLGSPRIHAGIRDHYDTFVGLDFEGRARELAWLHPTRAVEISGELYVLLGACAALVLVGAWRRRRWDEAGFALALIGPVLVTVFVWTQRRHAVAFVPPALLFAAAALPERLGPPSRALWGTALLVALCSQARVVDPAIRWTRLKVSEAVPMAALGHQLAREADGRTVIAGVSGNSVTQAPGVVIATAGLPATASQPSETLRWSAIWLRLDREPVPEGWSVLAERAGISARVYGAAVDPALRRCLAGTITHLAPVVAPEGHDRTLTQPGQGCENP